MIVVILGIHSAVKKKNKISYSKILGKLHGFQYLEKYVQINNAIKKFAIAEHHFNSPNCAENFYMKRFKIIKSCVLF